MSNVPGLRIRLGFNIRDCETMYDIIFFHPPLSFKKDRHPLGGVFETTTGTTDHLTMMPVGMLSLANELHQSGIRTAVVNVGKLFQRGSQTNEFDLDALLDQYPARIYGIGLHWAVHASGALELARACKAKAHGPTAILGGLSATYFTKEILHEHPYVDAVAQGECDGHIGEIVRALLETPPRVEDAPNIAYRADGDVVFTQRHEPDLRVVDYLDSHQLVQPRPRVGVDRESMLSLLPLVRGCSEQCLLCGGSQASYGSFFYRPIPGVLPVETVLEHFEKALQQGLIGVKIAGDTRVGGAQYDREVREGIKALHRRYGLGVLGIELFWMADETYLSAWREVADDLWIGISPESSHRALRDSFGKTYDNKDILDLARVSRKLDALTAYCFAYLLPGHTQENLRAELDLIEQIIEADPGASIIFQPFLFLDPGSPVFQEPEKYGYELLIENLGDVITAMERPYWYYSIGYGNAAFNRDEFFEAILDTFERKAKAYFRKERLSARDVLKTAEKVRYQRVIKQIIDNDPDINDETLQRAIEDNVPEFLRRSNTSLIVRPYFGEQIQQAPAPESLVYDAFPASLELLLRSRTEALEQTHDAIRYWIEARIADINQWQKETELSRDLEALMLSLLAPLELPAGFLKALFAFEWDLYGFLGYSPPRIEGPRWRNNTVVKHYPYDFVCIDELLAYIVTRGDVPPSRDTWYVFDPGNMRVSALSFDPLKAGDEIDRAHIRRMSILARRLVKAEIIFTRIISRAQKLEAPLQPRVLIDDESVTRERLDELLFGRC